MVVACTVSAWWAVFWRRLFNSCSTSDVRALLEREASDEQRAKHVWVATLAQTVMEGGRKGVRKRRREGDKGRGKEERREGRKEDRK